MEETEERSIVHHLHHAVQKSSDEREPKREDAKGRIAVFEMMHFSLPVGAGNDEDELHGYRGIQHGEMQK